MSSPVDIGPPAGDTSVAYAPLQGMRIGLDGRITYDFDGHVHATGLDLDAAGSAAIDQAHAVSWLRSDGALVAGIAGTEYTGIPPNPGPFRDLFVSLRSQINPLVDDVSIRLANDDSTENNAFIQLGVGNRSVWLYGGDSRSDFLQLTATANLKLDGPFNTGDFAIGAGADAFPPRVAAPSGLRLLGAIVIDAQYSAHNQVAYRPAIAGAAGFITTHNFGAAQTINFTYFNVVAP